MAANSSDGDLSEISFKHTWVISNWKDVVRNDALTQNTKTDINLEAESVVYAKLLLGTSFDNESNCVGLYWKLLGTHPSMDNVQFHLVTEILNSRGIVTQVFKTQENAVTKADMEIKKSFWSRANGDNIYAEYINSEGSLVIKLEFTCKNLPDVYCLSKREEFRSSSRNEFCQNFAALLHDEISSDVKILTKDKVELNAHKLILRAQCPVFASMFGSDFLESRTGIINVDDISAKTMKILLNYWYTGELQEFWEDDDTVAEFAYAAGKYQITRVLQMLDDLVGRDLETSDVDVDLLRIVFKLQLKNAEYRLIKRIVHQTSQAQSGTELLNMFSIKTDNMDEDRFGASNIFKACNDVMGENDDKGATFKDVNLMALACKVGMKNIEKILLKRIVGTVVKIESADELFALFDTQADELDRLAITVKSESRDIVYRL